MTNSSAEINALCDLSPRIRTLVGREKSPERGLGFDHHRWCCVWEALMDFYYCASDRFILPCHKCQPTFPRDVFVFLRVYKTHAFTATHSDIRYYVQTPIKTLVTMCCGLHGTCISRVCQGPESQSSLSFSFNGFAIHRGSVGGSGA